MRCSICASTYARIEDLRRHTNLKHPYKTGTVSKVGSIKQLEDLLLLYPNAKSEITPPLVDSLCCSKEEVCCARDKTLSLLNSCRSHSLIKQELKRRKDEKHSQWSCNLCKEKLTSHTAHLAHLNSSRHMDRMRLQNTQPAATPPSPVESHQNTFTITASSFQGAFRVFTTVPDNVNVAPAEFLDSKRHEIADIIQNEVMRHPIKVALAMKSTSHRARLEGTEIDESWDRTNQHTILRGDSSVQMLLDELVEQIDGHERRGSGWGLTVAEALNIEITEYQPISGSSFETPSRKRKAENGTGRLFKPQLKRQEEM